MTKIESAEGSVDSRAPLEALLTALWEDVLQVRVEAGDNFFALGGNSIKAARVMNGLQEKMNAIFHPASIFVAPTVASLADYCRQNYPGIFNNTPSPAVTEKLTGGQMELARAHLLHRNSGGNLTMDATGEKNGPAIFILSPPRSGSTLLRVILGGHPGLFSPPEPYLLSFDTLRQRRDTFSGRLEFFREGLIRALMELKSCPREDADALMESLEQQDLSTKACFGLMQEWAGPRRIVDKTPSYAFNPQVLRRAEAEFQDALFIHLTRHPLASVCSYEEIRADLVTGNTTEELPFSPRQKAELWWLISHQNIASFLQTIPQNRQYTLKYEDMVAEPEAVTRQLCGFLDIDFYPGMLDPYQEKKSRMTDGVSELSKMMGDQKFHAHKAIDTQSVDRWRDKYREDFLCDASWTLAESLGYAREVFADAEREEWEL
jgi:hypothetical protein